jgi:uncharacterized iron-regulated protein
VRGLLLLAVVSTGCVHGELDDPEFTIVDNRSAETISFNHLAKRLKGQLILIGEIHDNVHHHEIQAKLIMALAPRVLVSEHLDEDQVTFLDDFAKKPSSTVKEFPQAVNWAEHWGDDFEPFKPLYRAAIERQTMIRPGLFAKSQVKRIYQSGIGAVLSGKEQAKFGVATLPKEARQKLLSELVASHCGMLDQKGAERMLPVQQARDAFLSLQATNHVGLGQIVVVAGNGHVRRDVGMPHYLLASGAPEPSVIIQIEESEDSAIWLSPQIADFVIITKPVARPDPCDAFRKFNKTK